MRETEHEYSKYLFIAGFILLAYIAYLLIRPFFGAAIIGLLLAYILFPLHKRLRNAIKSNMGSAIILTIGAIILVAGAIIFASNMLITETVAIYDQAKLDFVTASMEKYIHSEKAQIYAAQFAEKGLNYFVSAASSIILKIPELLIKLFICLIVIFFALKDSEKLKKKIIMLMPIHQKLKKHVVERFSDTMDSIVYSTIIVALLQAIFATIGFYIFGVKLPLLWGLLTFAFGMLPIVGPTTVWLPISLYLYFTGNTASGIGLGIYGLVLLTILIENLLKPALIAKKGKMHPVVAVIGVLGGIALFGIAGLILGPFLISIFLRISEVMLGNNQ